MKQMVNGVVVEMTQEEIAEYNQVIRSLETRTKITDVIQKRNSLLSESDWTVLPDAPTDKKLWKDYRKALRDITDQSGFPDNVEWPTKPNEV